MRETPILYKMVESFFRRNKDCGLLRHAIIESDTTYSTGGIDLHYEVRTAWRATGDTVRKNQRFIALRELDDGISPAGDGPRD